jgi:hypothetical protein
VNLKVLLPLLEAASLENDEDMAERWASLLASAADPSNEVSQEAAYIEILRQLSPTEVLLLEIFYLQINFHSKVPESEWSEFGVNSKDLQQTLKISDSHFKLTIDNLMRLRLLDDINGNEVRFHVTTAGILCATPLGNAFVAACKKGAKIRIIIKDGKRYLPTVHCLSCNTISNIYWTKGGRLPFPANR